MKPEDVSQEAWDAVQHIRNEPFHWKGPEEVALLVARAIMAEADSIADWAEDCGKAAGEEALLIFAAAIRKRGETA
jgi:hypothetical protein